MCKFWSVVASIAVILTAGGGMNYERQAARLPGRPAEPQAPASRSPAASVITSLADIAGEWDVVSFDGYTPPRLDGDGRRHAYVDISAQELRFAINCNYSNMVGRIEGGFLFQALIDEGMQTEMGCGREREQRDKTFFGFFRMRPHVELLRNQRLQMTTSDHELLLERSSVRRLKMGPPLSQITGRWRVVGFTRFEGGRGWGAMYAPGRLTIAKDRLSYSRCPLVSVRVTYTTDYILRRQDEDKAVPAVKCSRVRPALTEVEPLLSALLSQSPEVERVSGERFILRSRDFAVLLTSEADYRHEFGKLSDEWEKNPG